MRPRTHHAKRNKRRKRSRASGVTSTGSAASWSPSSGGIMGFPCYGACFARF
jgi:hypothetical protein